MYIIALFLYSDYSETSFSSYRESFFETLSDGQD